MCESGESAELFNFWNDFWMLLDTNRIQWAFSTWRWRLLYIAKIIVYSETSQKHLVLIIIINRTNPTLLFETLAVITIQPRKRERSSILQRHSR